MSYRVLLTEESAHQLESVWRETSDFTRLVRSLRLLNAALANDPLSFGESREEEFRIGFELPIGIEFEVDDATHTVFIIRVWQRKDGG